MVQFLELFLQFALKEWAILAILLLLLLHFLQVRRFKKALKQEIHKQLVPQLTLELVTGVDVRFMGLYLKNEGLLAAKDVRIDDLELPLEDWGFKLNYIVKFESIEVLGAQENQKLQFKVFEKQHQDFSAQLSEKLIPHLVGPSFRLKVHYLDDTNQKICITFIKKQTNFYAEKVELEK